MVALQVWQPLRGFPMSRVHYAFDGPRSPRSSPKTEARRHLQKAMETAGLFAFGFGSSTLIMHFTASLYLASIAHALRPILHL